MSTVLALCSDEPLTDKAEAQGSYMMGVDTGDLLHVVILKAEGEDDDPLQRLVYLGVHTDFSELDALIKRFRICRCVIDGLPETHATRDFAKRNRGRVYMSFFNEHQRGELRWDRDELTVQVNRTEALDASRAAIRDKKVSLPRRVPIVETFARHMAADAKILEEDEETGAKKFRYVRTGEDHFSLAFTYAWMAAETRGPRVRVIRIDAPERRRLFAEPRTWLGTSIFGRRLRGGILSPPRRW